MLDLLIFFVCIFILIILVISILMFYYICYKTKQYVVDILSDISKILPHNVDYEYKVDAPDKADFLDNLTEFLIKMNMLTYNICGGYNYILPYYIKNIKELSKGGYIFKVSGENTYILTFRGTRTGEELINDLDSVQTNFLDKKDILVHRGFYRLWRDMKDDLDDFIIDIKSAEIEPKLIFTGHSLGAATSIFSALYIKKKLDKLKIKNEVSVEVFASPRIGNDKFVYYTQDKLDSIKVHINVTDIVVNLPPITFATLGNTWIYKDFDQTIKHDIQMGSVILNHRLDIYLYSISSKFRKMLDIKPIWFNTFYS